jgi:hypothetical protein
MKMASKFATLGALMAFSVGAWAQCSSPPENVNSINKLVEGNTVCGRPGSGYPGGAGSPDRWQEEHLASGQLWDYKLGNGHPIDPRKQVGTWTAFNPPGNAPPRIRHAYTGGSSFEWTVHNNNGVISFCTGQSGQEHARAKIKLGTNVGCTAADFPP